MLFRSRLAHETFWRSDSITHHADRCLSLPSLPTRPLSLPTHFRHSHRKYIAKLSKFVFELAIRFRLIRPWTDIESGAGAYTGVPGGARAEAERRR